MTNDIYTGNLAVTRRLDGAVHIMVMTPGPMRVTQLVVDQAEPEYLSRVEDVLTFHSTEEDGSSRAYRYRIVGNEAGPEGGWLLCEPLP